MKYTILFILSCLLFSVDVLAQYEQSCGEGPISVSINLGNAGMCYSKLNHSSAADATAELKKDVLAELVDCSNSNCTFRRISACKAYLEESSESPFTIANIDSTGGAYCFTGFIGFSWGCTKCLKDGEEFPGGTGSVGANALPAFTVDEYPAFKSKSSIAEVEKVFPNPSTGMFRLSMNVLEDESQIRLQVSDLTGRVIQEEVHSGILASNFRTQIDLSQQGSGLYLLSIYVNQELIETRKIKVQK